MRNAWMRRIRMSNRVFVFFVLLLLALGVCLGHLLAALPSFSIPAALNVVGIAYSIIAVIVLYETMSGNLTFRRIVVSHVAPILLWAHTVIPLGVWLSWIWIRNTPHGNQIAEFGFSFFAYSILPLSFLDATVAFPSSDRLKALDGRYRRFGLFLLLSGLAMQFIAALAWV